MLLVKKPTSISVISMSTWENTLESSPTNAKSASSSTKHRQIIRTMLGDTMGRRISNAQSRVVKNHSTGATSWRSTKWINTWTQKRKGSENCSEWILRRWKTPTAQTMKSTESSMGLSWTRLWSIASWLKFLGKHSFEKSKKNNENSRKYWVDQNQ